MPTYLHYAIVSKYSHLAFPRLHGKRWHGLCIPKEKGWCDAKPFKLSVFKQSCRFSRHIDTLIPFGSRAPYIQNYSAYLPLRCGGTVKFAWLAMLKGQLVEPDKCRHNMHGKDHVDCRRQLDYMMMFCYLHQITIQSCMNARVITRARSWNTCPRNFMLEHSTNGDPRIKANPILAY